MSPAAIITPPPRHIKITFSTLLVQLLRALHQVLLLCQHVPFKLIALKHNQPLSFSDWTSESWEKSVFGWQRWCFHHTFSPEVLENTGKFVSLSTATMIACKYFRQSGFIFAECDFQKFGWTAPFLEIWAPPEKKLLFRGVKPKKNRSNFFGGLVIHIKNTFWKKIGSKRPFRPSAVVRTIYRRLYGVATAN